MREKDCITLFPSKSRKTTASMTTSPRQHRYSSSVTQLRSFSAALSAFLRRHDDLQSHLDSLSSALDSPLQTLTLTNPPHSPPTLSNPPPISQTLTISPPNSQTLPISPKKDPTLNSAKQAPDETEIESLCARSIAREVRRYVSTHLSKPDKLRDELPRALKRAPNPAQLVLNAIGRFYLQGIKAFDKDSPMVPARRVSVLILEFYLLMDRDGTHVEEKTKNEAYQAAVDWRKRLMTEGGCAEADKMDGRGLLLLIGCFGIPKEFSSSDVKDLIFAGNVSEISESIRRSSVLVEKLPGIIEKMMKNKKDSKVADIICTFGMEDKFPPQPVLASFVEESIEAWNKAKKAAHSSLTAQRDADKRHLADLRSVLGCLKKHKLNSFEILPDCPITEKIATLEREITDLNKKIEDQVIEKRRLEPKPIKRPEWREDRRDEKRSRFSDHMPRQHMERDYLDGRISSDRFTPVRMLDSAFPGHLYPPPQYEMHRPLPDIRQTIATNGEAYRWQHEDAILRERILRERAVGPSVGVNGLFRQTSLLEGFPGGLSNPAGIGTSNRDTALGNDLYQFADAVAERELFGGSRDVPSEVPTHRLPFLY